MSKNYILLITSIIVSVVLLLSKEDKVIIDQKLSYVNEYLNEEVVFLLDSKGYLARTNVSLESNTVEDKIKEIIDILIIGGQKENSIPVGFKSVISSDTVLNDFELKNETLKLDFNEYLLDLQEEKVIESLAFSLTSLKEVKNVLLYINGEILTKYKNSNVIINMPLNKSIGINKVYDVINLNNITGVTTYFVSKYNDSLYYVPVTKFSNDKSEKFSIIVNELSSNESNTNFIKYLKNNTCSTSIIEDNETLKVNFNSDILDKNNILVDEIVNSLIYSIEDNYSIENVVFLVENKEILKKVL